MKKILTLSLIICASYVNAQQTPNTTASVEKSIFGIQTGFLGIWLNNESRLSNTIALKTELGFDAGLWGGDFYKRTGFLLTPVLTVEPRLYYNLKKRVSKSRSIENNSGNFISLKTSFHPDWFVISNYDGLKVISDFSIVPTWGIRRHIGRHFNYEAGIGVGYRYIFAKRAGYLNNESDLATNLNLRIGYTF
ncbi:hypothetical protein DBR43_27090 [Pedobacter sp. KBW06]|uniref:hypothetical protein n=1 Tax=Pedobacter sp. KBW06 TaxID=2153359 RepID=UPI000F5A51A1|nr:hypothetical protein [Pedobacter sp. KBW06]RQO65917.1 hypothetical protein DBR43_27090 [Pedobacter sp. KBW06]